LSGAQPSSIEQSSSEHAQIIEALRDRDADRAAECVTAHLQRVLDLYRKSLDVEPPESD
jgi:DNA-binding GntR family transcriptional regulator